MAPISMCNLELISLELKYLIDINNLKDIYSKLPRLMGAIRIHMYAIYKVIVLDSFCFINTQMYIAMNGKS